MLGEHLEIQHLISVVHLLEQQVTGQISWQTLQLLPQTLRLTLQRQDRRRKPASQTQSTSLPGIQAVPRFTLGDVNTSGMWGDELFIAGHLSDGGSGVGRHCHLWRMNWVYPESATTRGSWVK